MVRRTKRYTDEELEQAITKFKAYIEETGKVPIAIELKELGFPSSSVFKRRYGSYNKFIKSFGLTPNDESLEKNKLLQFLIDFKTLTGRTPRATDFANNPETPSPSNYYSKFGSWNKALLAAGLDPNLERHKIDDLLGKFKKDREGILRKKTLQTYMPTLADFHSFLKSRKKDWESLELADVVQYIKHLQEKGSFDNNSALTRPNSPRSLGNKANAIRSFLTWIEKWCKRKEIPQIINPAEIEVIKDALNRPEVIPDVPEQEPRSLTKNEIRQIRSAIDNPIERNIFDLGLNLGLRVSEYGAITMEMVLGKPEEQRPKLDGSESVPRYEREHYIEILGKGNKMRKAVVTEAMKLLIRKQLLLRKLNRVKHDDFFFGIGKIRATRLLAPKVHKLYKKLSERSGADFTAHQLRHSMSLMFQELGVIQAIVKQRLGHAGDVTQLYSRAQISERYKLFQQKVGAI